MTALAEYSGPRIDSVGPSIIETILNSTFKGEEFDKCAVYNKSVTAYRCSNLGRTRLVHQMYVNLHMAGHSRLTYL